MIQKRPLELAASPMPVKCLKHTEFGRFKEANDWIKPEAETLKAGSDLGSASTELRGNECEGHEEALKELRVAELVTSSEYHERSTYDKHPEFAKSRPTHERKEISGLQLSSGTPGHPTHVRWLPSPSRHILDQNHQTNEHRTITISELQNEVFHPYFSDERFLLQKNVPIGPDYQADISAWDSKSASFITEGREEDDESRWLGLHIWPFPGLKQIEIENKIGKGRVGTCSCIHPGSFECIEMHVREEVMRLKLELGEAFQLMGFDDMGERVPNQWTEEEEQRFNLLVKMNPVSLGRNFWPLLPFTFPTRSRKDFVSYYFNVFVLRRRAIQNRLDPENIDSDDDECDSTVGSGDIDDSDGYDSVEDGGGFEQEESNENKAERDWEHFSEIPTEQVLGTSSPSNPKAMNTHGSSSIY